ncbi:alginate lyase family protein [Rubripirellula reticaptiva]|uniref:Alginate lyase n=1 Tax=Rubripirellula reticaptiva TaxID=2528013 RepID=A0A5C6F8X4_9BACT|nr:alginate lyase family protein [Rubripirellula reticaptiva]TWU58193.1 Alginate lyase [Rubripirellula reticaptiva]
MMIPANSRSCLHCFFVVISVFWPSDASAIEPKHDFTHPGIAHSRAEIEFVKGKLASSEQPWASAWQRLTESSYASLDWKPEPRAHVERGPSNNPNIGSSEFTQDGTAAYTLALRWALSGDERYAQKSAEVIGAWSTTLKSISNHDARLLIGMDGQKYCNAAELLKHTWDGWPEEQQAQFRSMAREVWYPVIKDFYPSANGNWDASMLQTMIAMGIFLDDREMFDRAVRYFLKGEGNGAITNYFNEFGECQESGRDQAHTQMGLEFLANTCEFAWAQGVDLYAADDNRLLLGFEYTAKYNLGFDVPYEPFVSFERRYHYKSISDNGRGSLRSMYEKVYNHYHNRKGLVAEFTEQAAMKNRERVFQEQGRGRESRETDSRNSEQRNSEQRDSEQQGPERRRRSGGRSRGQGSLYWDTLMFANQPASFADEQ